MKSICVDINDHSDRMPTLLQFMSLQCVVYLYPKIDLLLSQRFGRDLRWNIESFPLYFNVSESQNLLNLNRHL